MSKVVSMRDAIARFVHDGDTVVIEGFTHLICFAAGHEIIRQKRRDLVLCRLTPDLIYDQLIAAGCARKLVFSWAGNPGVGLAARVPARGGERQAAARDRGVLALRHGRALQRRRGASPVLAPARLSGHGHSRRRIRASAQVTCPFTGESLAAVPALNPDVTIVHAQRADAEGNAQIWGLLGVQKEAAFASKHVIVVVEELVDTSVVRADPNRTLIPGMIVDAVVVEPWGAHPSYAQGHYDRDNEFYVAWENISRDPATLASYLDEYVMGVKDRADISRCTTGLTTAPAAARDMFCAGVNYGY